MEYSRITGELYTINSFHKKKAQRKGMNQSVRLLQNEMDFVGTNNKKIMKDYKCLK